MDKLLTDDYIQALVNDATSEGEIQTKKVFKHTDLHGRKAYVKITNVNLHLLSRFDNVMKLPKKRFDELWRKGQPVIRQKQYHLKETAIYKNPPACIAPHIPKFYGSTANDKYIALVIENVGLDDSKKVDLANIYEGEGMDFAIGFMADLHTEFYNKREDARAFYAKDVSKRNLVDYSPIALEYLNYIRWLMFSDKELAESADMFEVYLKMLERALQDLNDLASGLERYGKTLVHGDMGWRNTIKGLDGKHKIIDWESILYALPEYELVQYLTRANQDIVFLKRDGRDSFDMAALHGFYDEFLTKYLERVDFRHSLEEIKEAMYYAFVYFGITHLVHTARILHNSLRKRDDKKLPYTLEGPLYILPYLLKYAK